MRISRTAAGIAAVVVAGGGVGGWMATHRDASAGSQPSRTAPSITAAQVQSVAASLNNTDPKVVRTALAVPANQDLDGALIPGLQKLRPIDIDASTLKPLDSGTWQATAQVGPTGQRTTWLVFLTQVDGTWKLAATRPAS